MATEPIFRRYRRFFRADPVRDVDEELAFHMAMRVEELTRGGMSEAEARAATARRFGKYDDVRDECAALGQERVALERRADRWESFRQDVRLAMRVFSSNRGFAAVLALTIAIGIGANAAVFSVAYGTLVRPLPFGDADQLVRLWSKRASRGLDFFSVSPADYLDWRAQARGFSTMAAFERQTNATLVRPAGPEAVLVANVTPSTFALLGAPAVRGRALIEDDVRPGAPRVAVMSYDLWNAHFGAEQGIVGKQVTLDGMPLVVVGIMPPRFSVPGTPAQMWTPLTVAGDDHGNRFLRVLARLAPGTTIEQARVEMDLIASRLAREHPGSNEDWSVNIMSVPEMIVGPEFRRAILVLCGVVALVLLISCANAANLQLARAATRGHEMALRRALGATRGRIIGQLLTESLVLSVLAAAVGLFLAYGGVRLLRSYGSTSVPRLDDVRLDGPVLAFTLLMTLGSGILFGLLPALRASHPDLGDVLKERRPGGGIGGHRIRSALVVVEVSLSLVLLVGAGLFMRSFVQLQSVELGFDAVQVAYAPIQLPRTSYADQARAAHFFTALLERVRQMPGAPVAALVSSAPFAGPNSGLVYVPTDRLFDARSSAPDADYRVATPGYLRALGTRLVRGRDFGEADVTDAPQVVLVSETFAKRTWPREDPIGKEIRVGDIEKGPLFTVVGVVGDVRYQQLTTDTRPMMYFSALARPQMGMTLVVRGNASTLAPAVRAVVTAIDPSLPAPTVSAADDLIGVALATPRFASALFGVFAATALVLAAIGIYGVMAHLVRQRMHELGIRIALGAPRSSVVAWVVGSALRMTLVGVALGLFASWGATRLLSTQLSTLLFQVSPTDRTIFAGVALLLTVVAVIGSLDPARRATRADPLTVLRMN